MSERKGVVTFKGGPLTLVGAELKVGQKAPEAVLTANDMSEVRVSSFAGKIVVLSCVPSLDTPVCDTQTRKFNQKAGQMSGDVVVLTVSMDLPFAQKRWCGAAGVDCVKTLSDYKGAKFASAYGLLIKELHLLARAVIVLDKKQTIQYIQIVPEIAAEPDYDAVLKAVKQIK
ncbi:MAG: thiol peroxidase [Planctomycetes bacterium]|nr:thiol peroxidase [Planctomycetota bacterium]